MPMSTIDDDDNNDDNNDICINNYTEICRAPYVKLNKH